MAKVFTERWEENTDYLPALEKVAQHDSYTWPRYHGVKKVLFAPVSNDAKQAIKHINHKLDKSVGRMASFP